MADFQFDSRSNDSFSFTDIFGQAGSLEKDRNEKTDTVPTFIETHSHPYNTRNQSTILPGRNT